jgi:hypothetical protein
LALRPARTVIGAIRVIPREFAAVMFAEDG